LDVQHRPQQAQTQTHTFRRKVFAAFKRRGKTELTVKENYFYIKVLSDVVGITSSPQEQVGTHYAESRVAGRWCNNV